MNSIDNHSRQVWQNYYRDGSSDMYVGLMTFLFGYFAIKDSTSYLAIAFMLGSILLRQVKLHIVAKRTSEIQHTLENGNPIVPLMILLCVTFTFQIVVIRGTLTYLYWWDFWSLFALMLLFMGVFIYIGFKTRSLRYSIYAGLSLACGLSNILGLGSSHHTSQFLMTLGNIPFFIGLFLFVKYLRQVPESQPS